MSAIHFNRYRGFRHAWRSLFVSFTSKLTTEGRKVTSSTDIIRSELRRTSTGFEMAVQRWRASTLPPNQLKYVLLRKMICVSFRSERRLYVWNPPHPSERAFWICYLKCLRVFMWFCIHVLCGSIVLCGCLLDGFVIPKTPAPLQRLWLWNIVGFAAAGQQHAVLA